MSVRLGGLLVDGRPLRIATFRRLWTASLVSAVGGSFGVVAIPTQLFTQTGSSATVGVAAGISLAALVVSALRVGAWADVVDRRRLLLAGNAVLALTYLGLWLHAVLGLRYLPVLLVLVATQGIGLGATLTTTAATVPRLVPADLLVAANSLSSLTRYAGAVIGPLLAGALIPLVGLGTLYLCDALALAVVLWAVARLPALPPTGPVTTGGIMKQLGYGLRYLTRQRVLMAVLAVDLAAMVFALPVALLPELAERTYGGAPGGGVELGLLFAAYPAGVFVAGLWSGRFSRARRHGAIMATAAMMWGGCVVLLGLAGQLWLALAALAAGGAVNFLLSTFRNAITQAYTHDAMRGRIQGALTVVLIGGPQLANLTHGLAGAAAGARWAIGVGGALTVVAVALVLRAAPDLWHYTVAERDPAGLGSGT